MKIHRVTNSQAFSNQTVYQLFLDAAKECNYSDPKGVVATLSHLVTRDTVGCFVAQTNEGLEAVACVMLPDSPIMERPQVILAYSKNYDGLKAIMSAGVEFIKQSGYDKVWALDRSGSMKGAMSRHFKYIGQSVEVGNMLEFDI